MLFYIIRHGETDANLKRVIQGRLDVPLNKNGEELALITGRAMKGIRFDRCITSPLIRAYDTVKIVLRESGNSSTLIETDDRLMEMSFGVNEGKKLCSGTLPDDEAQKFFSDPLNFIGFPEGERIEEVMDRTQNFLKELSHRDDGLTYLIGIHGAALRSMLNFLYDDPSDFWHGHVPYNCAVNIVEARNGQITLKEDDKIYYDRSLIADRFKMS